MRTSLITGISGQDGSYLAEHLLRQGQRVLGSTRSVSGLAQTLPSLAAEVQVVPWDMRDESLMVQTLERYAPDDVYNLAALSSGSGMHDDPQAINDINGLAVARMLQAIRTVNPQIRFCQASSSEMFGAANETPQSERTAFAPRSPYGEAKCFAHAAVERVRREHGLFACSAILFNHESPRRGLGFVTRKITCGAARIKLGLANELRLGNLESRRDWGWAEDYVRGMSLMLGHHEPRDFVFATGQLHSVRDFCERAFAHLECDYRRYVKESPADFRPAETVPLAGDASRARAELGWQPSVGFTEMIARMVDADLVRLGVE